MRAISLTKISENFKSEVEYYEISSKIKNRIIFILKGFQNLEMAIFFIQSYVFGSWATIQIFRSL